MASVYDQVVRRQGSGLSAVEILGDPAQAVSEPERFVKYQDKTYRVAEEINVGIGGRYLIAIAPSAVQGTEVQIPSPNIDQPFLTQRVTIPSSVSLYLMLSFAQVSSVVLIDGDAICGDIFSEVSLNNGVRWPTAQTGQSFRISLINTDNTAAHEPRLTLTGVRLR